MEFCKIGSALVGRGGCETLRIEPWGENSLRVRATQNLDFSGELRALTERSHENDESSIRISGDAGISNGKIRATVNSSGVISFYNGEKLILREYFRNYGGTISRESRCLKVISREFRGLAGDDWKLTVRFESNDGEKIYGMGQYQHPYLDLKGCVLELSQRNSQVTVPFYLSSLGYGFLWNNPAVGSVSFGKNLTEWKAADTSEMDYWITADDSPAAIISNFTAEVGRTPIISKNLLGLWQCKLRYRTQDEVLAVARKCHELGVPVSVIVIDFFHWPYQGSWRFDEKYWPDVKAMTDELHSLGMKVMVSVWPSVDKRSENFWPMKSRGLLERTERGAEQTYDYQGDCLTVDMFRPEAREYLWNICEKNYRELGIDYFWLDNSEPDYAVYDYENYRFCTGPANKVGNEYPKMCAKAFFDGMKASGEEGFVSLIRSAWVGSQKFAPLVWSGDVPSTFEAFRDQLSAGLNMGMAGIPLWTTDVGGFMTDDVNDPDFRELLVRWYEFAVFTPFLRMHGDRGPHDIKPLDDRDFGGGYLYTGHANELWSYGEEIYGIFRKYLGIRQNLTDYIAGLIEKSHSDGSPLMRAMFYEYPDESAAWEVTDQFMLGDRYLVAPVMELHARTREVWLPAGKWTRNGEIFEGGRRIRVDAPLDEIPVFERV